MKLFLTLLAVAAQPACLDLRDGSSLSDLTNVGVSLDVIPSTRSTGGQALKVGLGRPGGGESNCIKLTDGVHATLDGAPMGVASRGDWYQAAIDLSGHGSRCETASFLLEELPSAPSGTASTIVIADDTTVWTVQVVDLLATTLAVGPVIRRADGYELALEWPSNAGSIYSVAAHELTVPTEPSAEYWAWWNEPNQGPSNVAVAGSRITLQAPTKIRGIALEAERLGAADTCDGPAMCGLDLNTRVDQLF